MRYYVICVCAVTVASGSLKINVIMSLFCILSPGLTCWLGSGVERVCSGVGWKRSEFRDHLLTQMS